jgi:pre-mRNA-splicing factor 38A
MANATDPLVLQVSGTDPQNALEYLLRQRIYQTRYWKEVGFGLTVADVLEKSIAHLRSIGSSIPQNTVFLSLLLKLLQLHPESALMESTFLRAEDFPYTRLLAACYLRLTARPVEIYQFLEPLLADYRSIRCYRGGAWERTTVDQFVYATLLRTSATFSASSSSERYWDVALPRLPARSVLQQAGYLPEGPRRAPCAILHAAIVRHETDVPYAEAARRYLEIKARVAPSAAAAWEKWRPPPEEVSREEEEEEGARTAVEGADSSSAPTTTTTSKKRKYGGLFKH